MFEQCSFPNKPFKGTVHPVVKKKKKYQVPFKPSQRYFIFCKDDCALKSWAAAVRICDSTDGTNQLSVNYYEKLLWTIRLRVKIDQMSGKRKYMHFSSCS